MRVECEGCGEECTNAYGTWNGYPYHITCIPMRKDHQPVLRPPSMFKAESREQVLAKEIENMGLALREAIQRAERAEKELSELATEHQAHLTAFDSIVKERDNAESLNTLGYESVYHAMRLKHCIKSALLFLDEAVNGRTNGPAYLAANILRDALALKPMGAGGKPSDGVLNHVDHST